MFMHLFTTEFVENEAVSFSFSLKSNEFFSKLLLFSIFFIVVSGKSLMSRFYIEKTVCQ